MCVCVRAHICVPVCRFFPTWHTLSQIFKKKKKFVWKAAVFTVYQFIASVVKRLACIYTAWSSISLCLLDKQSRFCCVHVLLYFLNSVFPSFVCFSVSLPRAQTFARILSYSTLFHQRLRNWVKFINLILHNYVLRYLTQPSNTLKKIWVIYLCCCFCCNPRLSSDNNRMIKRERCDCHFLLFDQNFFEHFSKFVCCGSDTIKHLITCLYILGIILCTFINWYLSLKLEFLHPRKGDLHPV